MILRFLLGCLLFFTYTNAFCIESTFESIKKKGILTVCSESGQIPYEIKTVKGEWYGFDIDMLQAFGKQIGVKILMKDVQWDGIIPAILTGKCDIIASSMVVTDERKQIINFSDTIIEDGVMALSLKSNKKIKIKKNNISDYDNNEITISVPQGTAPDFTAAKYIKHAKILKYQTNADSFGAVLTGKTDVFICDKSYILMMNLLYPDKFHLFEGNLFKEDIAVAFRKSSTGLKNEFNLFFAEWKKNGSYQETYNTFFHSLKWKK